MLMAILGITACTQPSRTQGVQLYQDLCVACHGETGQGDGPLAADLDVPVADLTLISARNGGTFPMAEVMSTIDGYSRAQHGNLAMPEFGAFLEDSPTVAFDSGDGIPTPTPSALVALAEYVESLQRAP
ncbi:MAG: c-type cytochrome [Pseudomonadota bacterium]